MNFRQLYLQTMQICGAGPYDQHIMLGEHELTDHSQSLAALGIFPGALLTLKVSFQSSFISRSACVIISERRRAEPSAAATSLNRRLQRYACSARAADRDKQTQFRFKIWPLFPLSSRQWISNRDRQWPPDNGQDRRFRAGISRECLI